MFANLPCLLNEMLHLREVPGVDQRQRELFGGDLQTGAVGPILAEDFQGMAQEFDCVGRVSASGQGAPVVELDRGNIERVVFDNDLSDRLPRVRRVLNTLFDARGPR